MLLLVVLLSIAAMTAGCGKTTFDLSGYVIEVQQDALLVVWGVSKVDIENHSVNDILDLAAPNAVQLHYKKAGKFKAGDKVRVQTTGSSDASYPALMTAKKVELDSS